MAALLYATVATQALQPPEASGKSATNPNAFLGQGSPTFVIGTAGAESSDRGIAAQVRFIRDMLFADARIVADTSIDVSAGPPAWPARPVLYGGPHVNQVLGQLASLLPFHMERGKLTVGDQAFTGDEYRLIAVVPARAPDADGPGYPEFLLYAGTAAPGVAEINAINHGRAPLLIADRFGALMEGTWHRKSDGRLSASFGPRRRRILWRDVQATLADEAPADKPMVRFHFPQQLPAARDEREVIQACLRGLSHIAQTLGTALPVDLSVFVYPDIGSKQALTGSGAHGHVDIPSRSIHLVRFDPAANGPLENLVRHEGTHVLAYHGWGAPGSSLVGEGLAVWVSGGYGGRSLDSWKAEMPTQPPSIQQLMGALFIRMPEKQSYPLAGLLLRAAVEQVGLANVRDSLWGATPSQWQAACNKAGTTPEELEATFRNAVKP